MKVYVETFIGYVSGLFNQLTEHIHEITQIWEPEKLQLQSKLAQWDSEHDRMRIVLCESWHAVSVISVSF